jgi:hypothetical protein
MPLTLSNPPRPEDWAQHTPTSDPGACGALLDAVAPEPDEISRVDRNLIAHYRGQASDLPESTRDDIDLRWLADQLAVDQRRHGGTGLDVERPVGGRLQGCCRDHTLFAIGVLRQHGTPARSRVGFAHYFEAGFAHDHVVPEYFDGTRWVRFDPEVEPGSGLLPDPLDLEQGPGAPFQTAAEVYTLMRRGELDPSTYGVSPDLPFHGERFVVGEVFWELAHRYGDEMLLWDSWGAIPSVFEPVPAGSYELVDEVAALLLAADAGDLDAEARLYRRYFDDERLRPGLEVERFSPYGAPPQRVALRTLEGH